MAPWLRRAIDKASLPCRRQDEGHHRAFRICQGHLPYGLRIPGLLSWEGTSSRSCEAAIRFFNVRRMVSWLMGSSRMTLAFSSRSRKVQRARPSGTGPQARAICWASARPSTLRRASSELTLRLRARLASRPSSANFLTVYDTVAMCTAQRFEHCSSRQCLPWTSSMSKSIWQRLRKCRGLVAHDFFEPFHLFIREFNPIFPFS